MGQERSARYMPQDVFLYELDSLKERNKFCFILGSGASRSSGIPTGQDMMEVWRAYLRQQPESVVQYYADQCGLSLERWREIVFSEGRPKSADYFDLYDLRYITMQEEGEEYLRDTMDRAQPSEGYHALARLMCATRHNVIITTNFDAMAEHAFVLEELTQPQMIGHDTLVRYIRSVSSRRPLIAKVHGDLMLHPLNRNRELQALPSAWKDKLEKLLTDYIPIVIGYAGGDHTLMEFLEGMKELPRVYWCSMWEREDERIERFLLGGENRYHVRIEGFDQIVGAIAGRLMGDAAEQAESSAPSAAGTGWPKIKPYGTLSKQKLDRLVGNNIIEQITFFDTRTERPPADAVDVCEDEPGDVVGWKNHRILCLAGAGGVAAPKNCESLFAGWSELHTVTRADLFDTSQVTSMSRMFDGCEKLDSINVRNWDTSNVRNMSFMFFGCRKLHSLGLKGWDTSRVTSMRFMFAYCFGLQALDLSGWDVRNVEDREGTFFGTRWASTPLI